MPSVVLLPLDADPPPPGEAPTLEGVERETARRLGPFAWLTATAGTASTVVVGEARTNAPVGGWEGLWLLRRQAVRANDRVRTVDRVDGASGSLVVDFPYEDAPVAGERIELHHLHPDQQLRADALAALRRCYVTDVAEVPAPTEAANGYSGSARAVVTEVGNGWDGGGRDNPWLLLPRTGNGNGASLYASPATTASGAGAVVDLTAVAFWLTAPRQVLAVGAGGVALPPAGRWGRAGGWGVYANRGRLYLTVPTGTSGYGGGVQVRAYRDAFGLVNGLDDPRGPLEDADELAVPVEYAAALAHAEAWRRHADRLEASAAEGRFATQEMAAAEATRCAAKFADWLFAPQLERGDPIGSPWGSGGSGAVNGLGGSGALAGAVVNQNDPYA